eukprot:1182377-Prorocentrum_minimum.AAC.3
MGQLFGVEFFLLLRANSSVSGSPSYCGPTLWCRVLPPTAGQLFGVGFSLLLRANSSVSGTSKLDIVRVNCCYKSTLRMEECRHLWGLKELPWKRKGAEEKDLDANRNGNNNPPARATASGGGQQPRPAAQRLPRPAAPAQLRGPPPQQTPIARPFLAAPTPGKGSTSVRIGVGVNTDTDCRCD